MAKQTLCATCSHSIFCPTWGEWKCRINERRIYSSMLLSKQCSDYTKRDKNFTESKCQCKDCLVNESLWDEESED